MGGGIGVVNGGGAMVDVGRPGVYGGYCTPVHCNKENDLIKKIQIFESYATSATVYKPFVTVATIATVFKPYCTVGMPTVYKRIL